MNGNYWRGLDVYRMPSSVFRAEYSRLRAAIELERGRVQMIKGALSELNATPTDASGEGIGEGIGICSVCGASADGAPCIQCGASLCDMWKCLQLHMRACHGKTIGEPIGDTGADRLAVGEDSEGE